MILLAPLRAKALIWKNTLLRRTRREQLSLVAFLVLTGYLAVGLFRGIVGLFEILAGAPGAAAEAFLTTLLSGLVTLALFWGLGAILNQLYVSSDLELYLAAPVPPRAVFLLKLVEGMGSLVLPSALSIACLLAYGKTSGGAWTYYVLAAVGFLCLTALLTAATMTIVMLMVRVLPARRTREAWLLLWTVLFGGVWVVWVVSSNRGGNLAQALLAQQPVIAQAGSILGWSPAGWLARGLVAWQAGHAGAALAYLGALLVASAVIVHVGFLTYQRAFFVGWSQMQETPSRKPRAGAAQRSERSFALRGLGFLPSQVRAVVAKEWITLPRDIRQLSGMFFPIMVGAVYIYLTATGDVAKQLPEAAIWMAMAITPLLPFFMMIYYTIGTVGLEGRAFALLRVAPLPGSRLLWAKFWASYGPTLLISEATALLMSLALGATAGQVLLLAVAMIWFSAGFVAIGVGGSTLNPNFAAVNARRVIGAGGMYAVLFLSVAFWIAQLGSLVWLLIRFGPAVLQLLLVEIFKLALPDVVPYLNTLWAPLALVGAQVLVWGAIALLWLRGVRWADRWEVTALDK